LIAMSVNVPSLRSRSRRRRRRRPREPRGFASIGARASPRARRPWRSRRRPGPRRAPRNQPYPSPPQGLRARPGRREGPASASRRRAAAKPRERRRPMSRASSQPYLRPLAKSLLAPLSARAVRNAAVACVSRSSESAFIERAAPLNPFSGRFLTCAADLADARTGMTLHFEGGLDSIDHNDPLRRFSGGKIVSRSS
jgi:hypothetical protein